MQLVELAYAVAKELPDYERYALSDQIRRSAVSVPSNIAEGQKRFSDRDTKHFFSIALASTAELETQLILAKRLHGQENDNILPLLTEVAKMLSTRIKNLQPIA